MPNYNQGKIYIIKSYLTNMVYIGSTCSTLNRRMTFHKSAMKQWQRNNGGKTSSFDILEFNDAYIELVEEFPCENKVELDRKEGEVIRATENTVNKKIAGRNPKEWYIDNKEVLHQYYMNNLEHRKEYMLQNEAKLNMRHFCPCGGKYLHRSIAQHLITKRHKNYIELNVLLEGLIV